MNWPVLISGLILIIYHSTKNWSILFFLGFILKSYSDDVCANWSILVMEFILSLLPINPLIKLQCLWHKFVSAMVCCQIAELGFWHSANPAYSDSFFRQLIVSSQLGFLMFMGTWIGSKAEFKEGLSMVLIINFYNLYLGGFFLPFFSYATYAQIVTLLLMVGRIRSWTLF